MKKEKIWVTQKDIACLTGFSSATVSKALRGFGDISRTTAEEIRKTAEKIGYDSPPKRRASRGTILGILYDPDVRDESELYYRQLLYETLLRADRAGYSCIHLSNGGRKRVACYLSVARAMKMAAVLVLRADYSSDRVRSLLESEIPAVLLNHYYDGCVCILPDEEENTKMLLGYLKEKGCRRLAYLYRAGFRKGAARKRVIVQQAAELGLPDSSGLFFATDGVGWRETEQFMRGLFSMDNPPDGILCAEAEDTGMLCRMITESGLRLKRPEKLVLAGFNEISAPPAARIPGSAESCTGQVFVSEENLADAALEFLDRLILRPETEIERPYFIKGKLRFH